MKADVLDELIEIATVLRPLADRANQIPTHQPDKIEEALGWLVDAEYQLRVELPKEVYDERP